MAKLFKITAYLVDPEEYWTAEDLKAEMFNNYDIYPKDNEIKESDIGEWDDDHILNQCNCPKSEFEKYFGQ